MFPFNHYELKFQKNTKSMVSGNLLYKGEKIGFFKSTVGNFFIELWLSPKDKKVHANRIITMYKELGIPAEYLENPFKSMIADLIRAFIFCKKQAKLARKELRETGVKPEIWVFTDIKKNDGSPVIRFRTTRMKKVVEKIKYCYKYKVWLK